MKEIRLDGDGLRLNCLDYGGAGKPPLLFLHGGSAHAHWWDFVAPAFVDAFHVLALDQRGHGDSPWTSGWAYGSRHYVADLDSIISRWSLGSPVLVGHSMGGHNVLTYATAHAPMPRAIVAIDSPPSYPQPAIDALRTFADRPPRRFEGLEQAVAGLKLVPRETLASREVLDHIGRYTFRCSEDGSWVHKVDRRTLIREPADLRTALSRITCRALIIKVSRSPILPLDVARSVVAAIPGARLCEIGDSYHHAILDNPAGVVAALKSFFAALG